MVDKRGIIVLANKLVEQLFGYDLGEVAGMQIEVSGIGITGIEGQIEVTGGV